MTPKLRPSYADSVTATSWSPWPKAWVGTTTAQRTDFITQADTFIKPARLAVVVSPPTLLATGTSLWQSLSQHSLDRVWASLIFSLHIARLHNKQFSDSANIYGGAETKNEFLGEIGAELWTSLGDGEVPGSFNFHQ